MQAIPEFRRVPARHGWLWIKQAFGLFKQNPLIWIVLSVSIFLLAGLLGIIPRIGSVVFQLISPVFTAGLMIGCKAIEAGEELEIAHLFAGFKFHGAQLVTVGGIYLVGLILIAGVMTALGGGALVTMMLQGHPDAGNMATPAMPGSGAGLAVLVALALLMPLLMAYWFAPTLVVFRNMGAVAAMKLSMRAAWANMVPFLVYGIIMFVLFVIAAMPLMLGFLIMLPLAFITYYTTYKDVFDAT
ncbi:MAG: BPSS1780 family membrane protein [Sulfuriferula sp.]